jgi:hypothetical protein
MASEKIIGCSVCDAIHFSFDKLLFLFSFVLISP